MPDNPIRNPSPPGAWNVKLCDRSSQPRQVYLQRDQRLLLLYALRIAAEDGSLYGAAEPGDGEYEDIKRMVDDLNFKLRP